MPYPTFPLRPFLGTCLYENVSTPDHQQSTPFNGLAAISAKRPRQVNSPKLCYLPPTIRILFSNTRSQRHMLGLVIRCLLENTMVSRSPRALDLVRVSRTAPGSLSSRASAPRTGRKKHRRPPGLSEHLASIKSGITTSCTRSFAALLSNFANRGECSSKAERSAEEHSVCAACFGGKWLSEDPTCPIEVALMIPRSSADIGAIFALFVKTRSLTLYGGSVTIAS